PLYLVMLWASATTAIYTLSLHDALPICRVGDRRRRAAPPRPPGPWTGRGGRGPAQPQHPGAQQPPSFEAGLLARTKALMKRPSIDRKSTRLNSSHVKISYAVFCLKNKKK